ncbi:MULTISPECIES: DUF4177 domain-containing protein [unclassified Marinobacter]|jgi:hypothetical protein|uniref:DUF4177 domain-containing protein n=1 Tax=unclassified Marinobacter TaxID=83889 RepID=UPI00126864F6|nr:MULTISPECIES: DUF4177 domain-containing protein [unclassified Marinobacter]QFS86284.1 hypothetical protein FIV08_05470 [Marinobacter sp. THAF197a]QFT50065.1 hypothetical protein FIU96_05395 [Marinobacter sp. THAF39]
MYQYKMVQVPPNIEVQAKQQRGNEAAAYLEDVVNTYAKDGWEFYRVDAIGVNVKPGCIAGLFGQKEALSTYHVVSFRKQA